MELLEKLSKRIDELLSYIKELKHENEIMRQEIVRLKAECELKSSEVQKLQEENRFKDREIESIVTKIESLMS